MTQRCCFDEGNSIIAIDLVNGGYIQIPDFTQIKNLLSAKFIDLRSNPLESVPHSSDFVGLQLLERLYLPLQYLCPGGVDVWQKIESLPTENHCIQQKDFCANSTLKCTEKSSCSPNGPGQYLCLCEFGYTGYKCLRYGHFPTALFLGLTLPLTAVLSVVLYYTQRRHVKTN
ncbi:unnamed protein product [Didymodactylos carnosus]|uniref:EGF-like domain-containing protein n=1 Tax=Didymodactylos carnosus TaxID=1234261 RepID=A0A813Z449_9BILA|nr:unnamed protein product [Didymodactylos carnosus]CAF3677658.1 unnamed protein product [Didymodactylos carnosus]